MKKQLNLLMLLAALSFIGCQPGSRKEASNAWGLAFDSLQINRTEHLFGDTAKPACNLILNISYASEAKEEKFRDSLNHYFMAFSLESPYANLSPKEAVATYAENYVNKYRNDLEPMYKKDEAEHADGQSMGAWYSYYKKIESRITRRQGVLLTYCNRYEEYTGGAHGMYMTTFLHLDLRTLTPVTLDDLFVEESEEELTRLLWKRLMEDHQAKSKEELYDLGYASTGDLTPIDNFYLDNQGITFYYNVYEIAPYALGPVTITLKRDEVKHLMGDPALWATE